MRLRLVLAADGLLAVVCLLGLDAVHRKAALPVQLGRGTVRVESVRPEAETSLRPGDVVRTLSAQRVATEEEIDFLCHLQSPGDWVQVGIDRAGRSQDVGATLVRSYTTFQVGVFAFVAAFFLGLGILVTLRRPDDAAALLFHAASASFALIIAATWGALRGGLPGSALATRVLFGAAYGLTAPFFLHFTLVFPRPAATKRRRAVLVVYALALALAGLQAWAFQRALASGAVADFAAFNSWFNGCRFLAAAGLLGGLARLLYSYRAAREESERRQLRLVLFGFTVSVLAFETLWLLPQAGIGSSQGLVPEHFISLAALVAPLAFATAIVREHALHIDHFVNRSTVYAILAALLLAVYATIDAVLVRLLGLNLESTSVASAIAVLCGVLLFDPIRRRVQVSVDRTFFRVRYDATEAVRALEARIGEALDESDLAETVVSDVDRLLQPERVALFANRTPSGELAILAERGVAPPELGFDPARLPRMPAAALSTVEAGARIAEGDGAVLKALGAVAVFPFAASDGVPLGLVAVARKRSGLRLTYEDLALLERVAREAGRGIERLRLREELRFGRAESRRLDELARARSDFVSSVTHELRTPVTSIRMFAELLRTGTVPADRAPEYLAMVEGEADRLTRLIQNVLDFGRIERSVKAYRFDLVAADAAVQEALRTLRYPLALAGFQLYLSLQAPGAEIRADADALRQAVVNLVENAMKYSFDAKEIAVSTRVEDGSFAMAVRDFGIGIPLDDRTRIFEPFVRGTGEAVKHAAGAGLGLSIVRHIMDAHRGRIDLESAPGRGSTFTLVFPLEPADAPHPGD